MSNQHLTAALKRTTDSIGPVVEAIRQLVLEGSGICLIPSGHYAQLPVAALILDDVPGRYAFVTTVPSRTICANTRDIIYINHSLTATVLSVENSPTDPRLTYPDAEISHVGSSLHSANVAVSTIMDAQARDFLTAISSSSIVHFSGHSAVELSDPRKSSLSLSDRKVEAAEILQYVTSPAAILCSFSACSSAQPSTLVLPDEFISVQSVALYIGFRFSVGALWPVFDVAAYAFMAHFYRSVADSGQLSIYSLSSALFAAQRWMKLATKEDIGIFLSENSVKWNEPISWANLPASARPFAAPRNWAAFYLCSRVF